MAESELGRCNRAGPPGPWGVLPAGCLCSLHVQGYEDLGPWDLRDPGAGCSLAQGAGQETPTSRVERFHSLQTCTCPVARLLRPSVATQEKGVHIHTKTIHGRS